MRAYGYTAHGGPGTETFLDLPRPVPGPGEVLVEVHAAGVNPVDWKRRAGFPAPGAPPVRFPVVFGAEIAGVVSAAGCGFAAGDAVFGSPVGGGYAQYALLPAATTARRPPALSVVDAAALPVAAATAYEGMHHLAPRPGTTLLITGAGGGVGVAAAQLARHAGVRVVGVASAGKKAFVEHLGVTHVESGPDLAARVAAAAPDGIDAILDLIGGPTLAAVAPLVTDRSKLLSVDRPAVARLGGAPVTRTPRRAVLDVLAAMTAERVLDPLVTATFPFDRAPDALRLVEDGHATGKVIIEVRAPAG